MRRITTLTAAFALFGFLALIGSAEAQEPSIVGAANSGRYTRSGDQITTEAYVALNPNYMADWGENHLTYTFRVEGDFLHLTWPAGFAGAENPPFTGTFRRVG